MSARSASGGIARKKRLAIETSARKARLLKYYTSGDIVKDYSNAVGYASIVFG